MNVEESGDYPQMLRFSSIPDQGSSGKEFLLCDKYAADNEEAQPLYTHNENRISSSSSSSCSTSIEPNAKRHKNQRSETEHSDSDCDHQSDDMVPMKYKLRSFGKSHLAIAYPPHLNDSDDDSDSDDDDDNNDEELNRSITDRILSQNEGNRPSGNNKHSRRCHSVPQNKSSQENVNSNKKSLKSAPKAHGKYICN